jgi:prepilin signal peptidase PulO-like enzyme (type II secretory pathway)
LTGFLLALVYWAHAPVMHGVVSMVYVLVFVVFFVALAVYDSKWFLLPDRLVFSLTAVAASKVIVLALLHHSWGEVWQAIFGAARHTADGR